eukprot:2898718-Prymnesium_polylepis.1
MANVVAHLEAVELSRRDALGRREQQHAESLEELVGQRKLQMSRPIRVRSHPPSTRECELARVLVLALPHLHQDAVVAHHHRRNVLAVHAQCVVDVGRQVDPRALQPGEGLRLHHADTTFTQIVIVPLSRAHAMRALSAAAQRLPHTPCAQPDRIARACRT